MGLNSAMDKELFIIHNAGGGWENYRRMLGNHAVPIWEMQSVYFNPLSYFLDSWGRGEVYKQSVIQFSVNFIIKKNYRGRPKRAQGVKHLPCMQLIWD